MLGENCCCCQLEERNTYKSKGTKQFIIEGGAEEELIEVTRSTLEI